jgi:hypothetical protein
VVDQSAEDWSTADPAQNRLGDRRFRAWWTQVEGSMWPLGVVVRGVGGQHAAEVPFSKDQHAVGSTPKGGRNHRNGSCGWPLVAARPSSSTAPATKPSTTAEALHGRPDEHWRAGCHGNGRVRFGKGSSEKEFQPGATSPATYFTSRRDLWEPEGETPSGHPALLVHRVRRPRSRVVPPRQRALTNLSVRPQPR